MANRKNIRKDRFTAQDGDFVVDKLVINGKVVKPGTAVDKKPPTAKKGKK